MGLNKYIILALYHFVTLPENLRSTMENIEKYREA